MNKMKWTQIALTACLLIMVSAAATQATTLRAFVSSTGNDANAGANCPQATPCRTFAGAFPTVTAGGELIALDSAGYGALTGANTINKAITIAALPGHVAFVVAATGTEGFTVNAPGVSVTVRNVSFNGSNAANTTGVLHQGGKLILENCRFAQLTIGLSVVNSQVDLRDCLIDGNGTGVKAQGQGANDQLCPPCNGTTQVRFQGGAVRNNVVAFQTLDPDVLPASSDNRKQFLFHSTGGSWTTNVAGNSLFQVASGTGCSLGCATIYLSYNNNQNPH